MINAAQPHTLQIVEHVRKAINKCNELFLSPTYGVQNSLCGTAFGAYPED